MGVQARFGTAGATGGGFSAQSGTLQPSFDERSAEPRWSWQQRAPKTWRDRNCWYSLWSWGCRIGGGDLEGYSVNGSGGLASKDLFEPYSCDGAGTQSIKFVLGMAVDSTDTIIPGAILQGFVTSTDAYTGEATSRADGSYAVPTQNPGVAHYVVGYIAGSPDRGGTTVNTLVPTNLDGT